MKSLSKLAAVAAVVLLAACPGTHQEDFSKGAPSQHDKSPVNAQANPENSKNTNPIAPPQTSIPTSRPGPAANQTVDVQLTEYEIVMPATLRAGAATLNVVNAGKEDHSLAIESNGYHAALAEPLKRGDRHALDVNLQPGTYNVYCPVDGHKGKGMSKTVTVQ